MHLNFYIMVFVDLFYGVVEVWAPYIKEILLNTHYICITTLSNNLKLNLKTTFPNKNKHKIELSLINLE